MKRLLVFLAVGVWAAEPLTIEELLASVDRAFPLIEAVVDWFNSHYGWD